MKPRGAITLLPRSLSIIVCISLSCIGIGCTPTKHQRTTKHAMSKQGINQTQGMRSSPTGRALSVRALVQELVRGKRSEHEKTRAIFRWITSHISYDVKGLMRGAYGDLSAAGVLKRRSAVCEGYANLFLAMAKAAGLEAVKIHGLARTGRDIRGVSKKVNHAWNAVKIKGRWRLLDATWASGSVSRGRFTRKYNQDYFLTPPKLFRLNHLPREPKWQLASPKLSRRAFLAQQQLRPRFYRWGFRLLKPISGPIKAGQQATLNIKVPRHLMLTAKLHWFKKRFAGYARTRRRGATVQIKMRFRHPGEYQLSLFGCKRKARRCLYLGALSIEAEGSGRVPSLPPRYHRWSQKTGYKGGCDQCRLDAPTRGVLNRHEQQHFRVILPFATKAFIGFRGKRYPLRHVGRGLFVGTAKWQGRGRAILYAGNKKRAGFFSVVDWVVL